MKKVFIFLALVLLVAGGIWYEKTNKAVEPETNAYYHNSVSGLSFSYPLILTASTTGKSAVLHHDIPFTHHDFCDFKGDGTTTQERLTDFHIEIHIENRNIVDTMKMYSPYIPEESFVNGEVLTSTGFIEKYSAGKWNGYKIFEGVEGCGKAIYYLPVSDKRTLVISQELITPFTGAIDQSIKNAVLSVPDVVTPEKSDEILLSILTSLEEQ